VAEPFLSEIRIMSFQFAPKGWALCNGQILPINQNQALFSLLGTTYGGNGQTTFALPNLQARVPIHFGNGATLGESGGSATHTLQMSEMPAHTHEVKGAGGNATTNAPVGNLLASATSSIYLPPQNQTTLSQAAVSSVGGSQPHENMQPYLTVNFCIALVGIFPSQN
jgi:microcystin-dependent protein